jgi:hypothetical protein
MRTLRIIPSAAIVVCTACVSLHGGQAAFAKREMTPQKMQDPVVLNPATINCLLAGDAMRTPGIREKPADSKLAAKHYWIEGVTGDMKVAWNVTAAQASDYRVTFIVNCKKGTEITVTGANNSYDFRAPEAGWQRSAAQDVLKLPTGPSIIILHVKKGSMDLKGIDLVNVAEEQNVEKRIQAFRGDTSWMKIAGYGIMVQGGGWTYPPKGDKKPWPGFAEDFDAKKFVDEVDEMGGKYLVWSATWVDFLFPAPIKAIEEILPQRVSKRDLIADLIAECRKHNIRFMLYYHLGHDKKKVLLAKGWKDASEQDFPSRTAWLEREVKIFTEIGRRYGTGLDAYFLDDGCTWYPADFEKLGAALKTGNPKRVICYNPWILPSLTPFQDFWCGEGFNGWSTPYPLSDGVIVKGPQTGLQLFGSFMFDGPDWGIHQPNTIIQNTRWTAEKIVTMTRRLEKERYSVAINLLLYEEGSMNPANVRVLKEAARQLKRGKWGGEQATNDTRTGEQKSLISHPSSASPAQ